MRKCTFTHLQVKFTTKRKTVLLFLLAPPHEKEKWKEIVEKMRRRTRIKSSTKIGLTLFIDRCYSGREVDVTISLGQASLPGCLRGHWPERSTRSMPTTLRSARLAFLRAAHHAVLAALLLTGKQLQAAFSPTHTFYMLLTHKQHTSVAGAQWPYEPVIVFRVWGI